MTKSKRVRGLLDYISLNLVKNPSGNQFLKAMFLAWVSARPKTQYAGPTKVI